MSNITSEEQAPRIRVLVANLPATIAESLLPLIREQPDMLLVGQVQGNVELLLATSSGVDAVILGAPRADPPPGICSHLLSEFPNLKILVVDPYERPGLLYWMGLCHVPVDPLSGATVINMLRQTFSSGPPI